MRTMEQDEVPACAGLFEGCERRAGQRLGGRSQDISDLTRTQATQHTSNMNHIVSLFFCDVYTSLFDCFTRFNKFIWMFNMWCSSSRHITFITFILPLYSHVHVILKDLNIFHMYIHVVSKFKKSTIWLHCCITMASIHLKKAVGKAVANHAEVRD